MRAFVGLVVQVIERKTPWVRFVLPMISFFVAFPTACAAEQFTTTRNGSGGTPAAGGTSAAGGSDGSGGAGIAPLDCDGDMAIRLTTLLPERSCAPSGPCANSWLSIRRSSEREPLRLELECEGGCDGCEAPPCPETPCQPVPFTDEIGFRWDGSYLEEGCEDGNDCLETRCAEPGTYFIRYCLERAEPGLNTATSCTPNGSVECDEHEIEWPFSGTWTAEISSSPLE